MKENAKTITENTLNKLSSELEQLPIRQLRDRFCQTLGYASQSRNRPFLIRKILWGIQMAAGGDISPKARDTAIKMADERDVVTHVPKFPLQSPRAKKKSTFRFSPSKDSRLPVPGSVLVRQYNDREIRVTVGGEDFEFEGKRYKSLSSIAREVTGGSYNGFLFFKLK